MMDLSRLGEMTDEELDRPIVTWVPKVGDRVWVSAAEYIKDCPHGAPIDVTMFPIRAMVVRKPENWPASTAPESSIPVWFDKPARCGGHMHHGAYAAAYQLELIP